MEDNKNLEGKKVSENTEHTPPPVPSSEETKRDESIVDRVTSSIEETVDNIEKEVVEPIVETIKEEVIEPVVEAAKELEREIEQEVRSTPPPPQQGYNQQQAYYPPIVPEKNNLGLAGFILSIVAFLLFWLPFINVICWLLGLIFSAIGVFRKPKGLAIAGLVISLIGVIFFILTLTLFATAAVLGS
ncbi:hypothetical protein MODO_2070 [Myroides odoratimimus]|uniref:DUF4190 domain-containing protein n=1 Tax=Myroides odoratimimus CCUG 10230 TaxID=883150 RepID=A0ABP2N7Q4_9FLAO|nr:MULTISPECIES: DUF4190 domain-containing protein [Myroides]AJA68133.1 hypothetical protein MYRA21_0958 [Myroides sp. A21]EHO06798.1 hypothetical protein HMPREF9712_03003 [Myroides odoratimimus CCUG 10230]MCA4805947.1 hypothetical protein [Myroides odoratimimus]MCO7722066.1 hypothetical protein [Myroides odoratimimus]MDM1065697.1 hypothetical protein [Myroides odoratimimus]